MRTNQADTIRVLVATDNHVGYAERDPFRGNDSWQTFDEIMRLAKERDVDMVLLGGDLFHENTPSRKSLFQVMRSLRMNCLGDKPCELELLSDSSENFAGAFDHVNYEDQDINIAIPVFSIHGNHDDPSGESHLAALDILQVSGLLNYYGRTYESDNIQVKPVLLQKGRTKLALYGLSNVRDERLYRTFRDGGVTFFQPNTQKDNWFNLLTVHQNHHAYNETGYLPENFLPEFMDLVVWGHEHECDINPKQNPVTGFHVMQPGSSVATSLMPGEAVPKHVALLSITGKEFQSEAIPLKTVRPFVMKEIILSEEPGMKQLAKQQDNRMAITKHLEKIVKGLIAEAKTSWLEAQTEANRQRDPPLPLIRLRVEYSAPEGGKYDVENAQRFSHRFIDQVANSTDVVQFHRKKTIKRGTKAAEAEIPESASLANLNFDNVKVEKLVRDFLTAQSLHILPQNSFGDAVSQFVDKMDNYAMEVFVKDSLERQRSHLNQRAEADDGDDADNDDDDLATKIDENRAKLEQLFNAGKYKIQPSRLKPKPDDWDSDIDGDWADNPMARHFSDDEENDDHVDDEDGDNESLPAISSATRGRGRGRGRGGSTRGSATSGAAKREQNKAPNTAASNKGKKAVSNADGNEDDDDVIMVDDFDEEDEVLTAPSKRAATAKASNKPLPKTTVTSKTTQSSQRQTQLSFGRSPLPANGTKKVVQPLSDDEISDDEDAFESVSAAPSKGRR